VGYWLARYYLTTIPFSRIPFSPAKLIKYTSSGL